MPDTPAVEHNAVSHRFFIRLEGREAALDYRQSGRTLEFYHTFVPEEFRGRGLAEQIVRAGFEYAKANKFTVDPTCPYIALTYLRRHPEYAPLVKK